MNSKTVLEYSKLFNISLREAEKSTDKIRSCIVSTLSFPKQFVNEEQESFDKRVSVVDVSALPDKEVMSLVGRVYGVSKGTNKLFSLYLDNKESIDKENSNPVVNVGEGKSTDDLQSGLNPMSGVISAEPQNESSDSSNDSNMTTNTSFKESIIMNDMTKGYLDESADGSNVAAEETRAAVAVVASTRKTRENFSAKADIMGLAVSGFPASERYTAGVNAKGIVSNISKAVTQLKTHASVINQTEDNQAAYQALKELVDSAQANPTMEIDVHYSKNAFEVTIKGAQIKQPEGATEYLAMKEIGNLLTEQSNGYVNCSANPAIQIQLRRINGKRKGRKDPGTVIKDYVRPALAGRKDALALSGFTKQINKFNKTDKTFTTTAYTTLSYDILNEDGKIKTKRIALQVPAYRQELIAGMEAFKGGKLGGGISVINPTDTDAMNQLAEVLALAVGNNAQQNPSGKLGVLVSDVVAEKDAESRESQSNEVEAL